MIPLAHADRDITDIATRPPPLLAYDQHQKKSPDPGRLQDRRQPARTLAPPPRPGALAASQDSCSTSEARCPGCQPGPLLLLRGPVPWTLAPPPRPGALAASQDSCGAESRGSGRCSPATYMSPKRGCSPAKNAFFLDFYMRKAVDQATRSPPRKHLSVSEPSKTPLSSRQKALCCGSLHHFRSSVHSNKSGKRS